MSELHLQDQNQGDELVEACEQELDEADELSVDELDSVAGGPGIRNGD